MEEIGSLELTAFSDKGASRENNEDNLYCSLCPLVNEDTNDFHRGSHREDYDREKMFLTAVFDGMGGTSGGELAALTAARHMPALLEGLQRMRSQRGDGSGEEIQELLWKTKRGIEEEIARLSGRGGRNMPGATCCGFWSQGGRVQPFWIGDSRMYLLRNEQLIQLTKDQTVAQEKIDYGLMTPEQARKISGWHTVTAYIGDGMEGFSLGKEFVLKPGDRILLCTDGLSDLLSPHRLLESLLLSPQDFEEVLLRQARSESGDNVTAIRMEFLNDRNI